MTVINFLKSIFSIAAFLLTTSVVQAYGGGGSSSSSCQEPKFYDESPQRNAVLSELGNVSVVASDNTDVQTLEMEIGNQRIIPQTSVRRSGELDLKATLSPPITQQGKVRIAVSAKSKDGCTGSYPYFVEIKP
jgi:hypothetical protein